MVKKFFLVKNIFWSLKTNFGRKTHSDAGKSKVTARCLRKIKNIVRKHPLSTSKTIFDLAGVQDICKATCNKFLKTISYATKPIKKPLLTPRHKLKHLVWCRKLIKLDFSNVVFMTSAETP